MAKRTKKLKVFKVKVLMMDGEITAHTKFSYKDAVAWSKERWDIITFSDTKTRGNRPRLILVFDLAGRLKWFKGGNRTGTNKFHITIPHWRVTTEPYSIMPFLNTESAKIAKEIHDRVNKWVVDAFILDPSVMGEA